MWYHANDLNSFDLLANERPEVLAVSGDKHRLNKSSRLNLTENSEY